MAQFVDLAVKDLAVVLLVQDSRAHKRAFRVDCCHTGTLNHLDRFDPDVVQFAVVLHITAHADYSVTTPNV